MLHDDIARDTESEPCAFAWWFGREERLEDSILGTGCHPGSGISYREHHKFLAPRSRLSGDGDTEVHGPAGLARLNRVHHEVDDCLLELARIGEQFILVIARIDCDVD